MTYKNKNIAIMVRTYAGSYIWQLEMCPTKSYAQVHVPTSIPTKFQSF